MNTEEVHALLECMRPLDADLRTRCDVRDGVVNLYIGQDVPGGRWSVVQTPGVGWFSVRMENNFTYDYVDEDADADETRSVLNHFVKLAATLRSARWKVLEEGLVEATHLGYSR